MRKKLLVITALASCMTAWSVDLLTESGIPATKGILSPPEVTEPTTVLKNAVSRTAGTLPYFQSFDTQDAMGELTLLSSVSSKQWKWLASCPTFNESCAKVETNYFSGVKAYMVLPAMELQQGEYVLEFDAWGQSDFNPEFIAAYCATGNTIADMGTAQIVVAPQQLQGYCYVPNGGAQEKQHHTGSVEISTPGTYYFAIASAKEGSGMAVFVDNISVTQAVTATAPSAVTDMSVEPDGAGALSAIITVTAPATDIDGNTLEQLDGVTIYRGAELVATLPAAPGATVTVTDTPDEPGNYLYRAVGFNAGGAGEALTVQAYVGHAAPAAPAVFHASHGSGSDLEVVLDWDTPLDIYGKTFATDEITYSLKCTQPGNIDWFDPLVSDLSGNSYTFTAPAFEGEQAFLRFSMVATNKYGQESAVFFPDARIPVGTPYTTPFHESFAGGNLSYLFRTKMEGNFGLWGLADDELYASYDLAAQDGDNGFMLYAGMEEGDAAGLYSGVIDLSNLTNPALSFYYYGQDTDNELLPMVKHDKEFEPLCTALKVSEGNENMWNHRIYSLLPYSGKRIELGFRAISRASGFVAIDNISIFDQLANDLSVSVTAPAKVAFGEAITLRANISNIGAREADGYIVAFMADGEEVARVEGTAIAPAADATVETTYYPQPGESERTYTFQAQVLYDADENTDNNLSAPVTTRTVKSIHPAPQNLVCVVDGEQARFIWDAPDTSTEIILPETESFESVEPWGSAEATGWIIVDNDHGASGYFQDFEIPAITGGEPASWFVLDGSDENCRYYGLTPRSGKQALAVLYNADGKANDDWAISPELSGDAQSISFFARSYSASYPDDFEVLYSSGSTATADFKPVPGASYKAVSSSWTEYVVSLPEGARRFAIRYNASDAFCLIVDDITFIPADGAVADYKLLGYRFYIDGVPQSTMLIPAADPEMIISGNIIGKSCHVTAVYNRYGESAPSNIVIPGVNSISLTGQDTPSGNDTYYTPGGIRLTGTPSAAGIYIVRHADGSVSKISR